MTLKRKSIYVHGINAKRTRNKHNYHNFIIDKREQMTYNNRRTSVLLKGDL